MATFQLVLLNTYKREGGIWEPRTFYLLFFPYQSPGGHLDSNYSSKRNSIHNETLTQLLKLHCFIFNEPYCVCWHLGSAGKVKLSWSMKHLLREAVASPDCKEHQKQMVWQVTWIGVSSSTGVCTAERTSLGSCAKMSKPPHQNEEQP